MTRWSGCGQVTLTETPFLRLARPRSLRRLALHRAGSMLAASTSHLPHTLRCWVYPSEEESRCGPRGHRASSIRLDFPMRILPRRWPRARRTVGSPAWPKPHRFPRPPSRSFDLPTPSPECDAVEQPSHELLFPFSACSIEKRPPSIRYRYRPTNTPGLPHPAPLRLQAFSASWRLVPLHAFRPCCMPVTLMGFCLRRFPLLGSCSSVRRARLGSTGLSLCRFFLAPSPPSEDGRSFAWVRFRDLGIPPVRCRGRCYPGTRDSFLP
jgi:hypothetical protein